MQLLRLYLQSDNIQIAYKALFKLQWSAFFLFPKNNFLFPMLLLCYKSCLIWTFQRKTNSYHTVCLKTLHIYFGSYTFLGSQFFLFTFYLWNKDNTILFASISKTNSRHRLPDLFSQMFPYMYSTIKRISTNK